MTSVLRRVLVMLPTYNESRNVEAILAEILNAYEGIEVLVIDDSSPDGTSDLVRRVQVLEPRVHLLVRRENRGLANAYFDGMKWGTERDYDVLIQMDADFSHDPKDLPRLIERTFDHDVVVGSRYTENGGLDENWPWHRKALSAAGNWYARLLLGLIVRDLTSGFVAWNREALRAAITKSFSSQGYGFQVQLKHLAFRLGSSITEVPIIFRDRTRGNSKMSLAIAFEAMVQLPLTKLRQILEENKSISEYGGPP